jgi:NAD(P)-dependent dehydrogenase (short-subunit alcohol dehydrogenase family)
LAYEKVLILGGYGRAGRAVASALLGETDAAVVLAGRDGARAQAEAARLAGTHGAGRAAGAYADAAQPDSLKAAAADADLVVVCAPLREGLSGVAAAALAAGADLIDLNFSAAAWEALCGHGPAVKRAKLCFLGQAGLVPGVPALLVRHAAARLGRGARVAVAELMRLPEVAAASMTGVLRDLRLRGHVFRGGAWRPDGGARKFDFGPHFRLEKCRPFDSLEMAALPGLLKLEELGQYAAGLGSAFANAILTTWLLLGLNRTEGGARLGGRLLSAALRGAARPPYAMTLKLEAGGRKGEALQWYVGHEDGYAATACAVAAAVAQLADGSARRPGVHMMGHILDPGRFFDDIVALGLDLTEKFG